MSVFPNWTDYAVHQRRSLSGCIPTGYEMILRAAGAEGVDFSAFQDEFDLEVDLGKGQTDPRNDFGSVATLVNQRYPWVVFEQRSFPSGSEKVAFVDSMLAERKPVLISLAMTPFGGRGWHIMPIVDADADKYLLLKVIEADGTPRTEWIEKSVVVMVHDRFKGGKEVAFLAKLGKPGSS